MAPYKTQGILVQEIVINSSNWKAPRATIEERK